MASLTNELIIVCIDSIIQKKLWNVAVIKLSRMIVFNLNSRRLFTFWLRENNRSVPTRYDENLKKVEPFAHAVEEISGAAGYKIPARRAINVGAQVMRELSRDWLILKWECAWGHVLEQAAPRWKGTGKQTVMLRTRLETRERAGGRPVALVDVLFVLQRLAVPTPGGVK